MSSPPSQLPGWTPDSTVEASDSSESDELSDESQDSPTGSEDMGNKISVDFDQETISAAIAERVANTSNMKNVDAMSAGPSKTKTTAPARDSQSKNAPAQSNPPISPSSTPNKRPATAMPAGPSKSKTSDQSTTSATPLRLQSKMLALPVLPLKKPTKRAMPMLPSEKPTKQALPVLSSKKPSKRLRRAAAKLSEPLKSNSTNKTTPATPTREASRNATPPVPPSSTPNRRPVATLPAGPSKSKTLAEETTTNPLFAQAPRDQLDYVVPLPPLLGMTEDNDTSEQNPTTPTCQSPNQNTHSSSSNTPAPSTPIRPRPLPQPTPSTSASGARPAPARFPLSPPQPTPSLSANVLGHRSSPDTSNESSDIDLPDVEQMIAQTQPKVQESPSRKRTRQVTPPSEEESTNDRPSSPVVSIKRQQTNSPCLSSPPPKKKQKLVLAKPAVEIIDLVSDSSSDEAPKKNDTNKVESAVLPPRRLPRPSVKKQKRKSLPAATPPSSPNMTRLQGSLSRHRPKRSTLYQKHQLYWHLDGNVLVRLEGICFRLHRSILARQSTWFEDRFNQGEEAPEYAPGDNDLPLYDLSHMDIAAKDFEEVIRASEDTLACFQEKLEFSKLFSLLRASIALGFTIIEKYASEALSEMWSADIADVSTDKIDRPTESLALARQCALFPVIKRALYELVRLSNFGQVKAMPGIVSSASEARLGPHDKDLLLSAREQLSIAWREALDVDQFPACVGEAATAEAPEGNDAPCAAANRTLSLVGHHEIIKECGIQDYEYDPVCGLQVLAEAPWKEKGFCQACVTRRQVHWLGLRERIWIKLDEWFEV
ncbi:hypothetical protein DXG01_000382 [Tephrocybe rancida]|nr:hypothetical protein DXG01_000382 [Tephrocybe rancida]